ncbi:ATPase family associated with various cellular activities (AAA) [Pseudobutyrivibrio ruminis DSM 9787]|uniref:ATPase family associated with various cellular activities (AAA) n=2 Tax=Pseudobutyrivibrio ruminis TaxID=46206 RepID=A0A285SJQ2_9FIRM|nr:ATPase family associated with various cellular activities (AAA) [Pseudobutyrivibrio ruminis DSM 9787]
MLCYNLKLQYKSLRKLGTKEDDRDKKNESLENRMAILNAEIYSHTSHDDFFAFAYNADDENIDFAIGIWPDKVSVLKVKKIIINEADKTYGAEEISASPISEITTKEYGQMLEDADNRDYLKRSARKNKRDLDFDFYGNSYFKLNETVVTNEKLSKKEAVCRAREIMADVTLFDELDRIYAKGNARKFYGYPVHYCISSGNRDSGMEIIKLLVQMLYSQGRLLSSRVNLISQIKEGCYDESDLEHICKHADGAAIVIDMRGSDENHGNYAQSYKRVIRYFSELVEGYCEKTLFFFLEECENPGFAKELLIKTDDFMDRIEIHEGAGNREEALAYLDYLAKESTFYKFKDESLENYLQAERKVYKCYDVHAAFNKWTREVLKNKVYSSYKECKCIVKKEEKKKKKSAYKELQEMVGLSEVKALADQIVASYKMQSIRDGYGLKDGGISKHMVFTGNPGSAKTTVARLLTDILTEEGVLKTGALVECGRADLVGQYVGWTAREVRDKFKEASGGVLFIDEAYSLVDDRRSFGAEAINTIVQEMENHRDDVIVIFAGYPDKMADFLDQNEGLRSRIAFHIDFPDYNGEELTDILKLMAKNRGLKLDNKAIEKCKNICEKACIEKEFGNGRFVRNLLEQAVLKQSQRLYSTYKDKEIPKSSVEKLLVSDFDVNLSDACLKKKANEIGFAV